MICSNRKGALMPKLKIESPKSSLKPIHFDGSNNTFIVENIFLERILFNRNLIGLPFSENCENATYCFFNHFYDEILGHGNDIAELMVLTKSMYYWCHNAFSKAFNKNLQTNFVYTSRDIVAEEEINVAVRTCNFDAPVKNLIIGDTIASGETISVALKEYLKYYPLERVYIFSIAGSKVGGQRIVNFCKKHNIKVVLAYGLAAFGLAPNGFDLSFLHPDTITSPEYLDRAKIVFKGRPVSSVGWDFGSQAQAIQKYRMLCWVEEIYWNLEHTGVFQETEQPTDLRIIEKECSAFEDKLPNLKKHLGA
jgi:hypothetical protein